MINRIFKKSDIKILPVPPNILGICYQGYYKKTNIITEYIIIESTDCLDKFINVTKDGWQFLFKNDDNLYFKRDKEISFYRFVCLGEIKYENIKLKCKYYFKDKNTIRQIQKYPRCEIDISTLVQNNTYSLSNYLINYSPDLPDSEGDIKIMIIDENIKRNYFYCEQQFSFYL